MALTRSKPLKSLEEFASEGILGRKKGAGRFATPIKANPIDATPIDATPIGATPIGDFASSLRTNPPPNRKKRRKKRANLI